MMQAGKITERGTHKELLAENGGYNVLWQAQKALETYCTADAGVQEGTV